MLYSIIAFCVSLVFGAGMLLSGSSSNKLMRHYEFLKEVIEEKKSLRAEEKEAEKQRLAYKAKLEASGVSGIKEGSMAADTGM